MHPKLRISRSIIVSIALAGTALMAVAIFSNLHSREDEMGGVGPASTPAPIFTVDPENIAPRIEGSLASENIKKRSKKLSEKWKNAVRTETRDLGDFLLADALRPMVPPKRIENGASDPYSEAEDDDHDQPAGGGPEEAAKFRNLQLQDDEGKIPIDGLQKARIQADRMRARQQKRANEAGKPEGLNVAGIDPGSWAWLGPGNIGGRIRTIVIDPADTNKLFIGSVSGGIWRSTNAGAAWTPVDDFMANLAVSTMVMDPNNSNIIYAGTGESFTADLTATEGETNLSNETRGDGVFKSTDGGTTWTQLASTDTSNAINCPAAGPTCPWSYVNRLTISPNGSTILAANIGGIYRSTDGGTSWNLVTSGTRGYLDIDFDPTNSQKAVASGKGQFPSVFSINGGSTWQNATYSPAINAATLGGSTGRIEIVYAPSNPAIVYAMVDATQGTGNPPPAGTLVKGNLYKSTDGGANFALVNASNPGNTFLGGQGNYGNIIWVNPQDPNFLVVGGINLYISTDGGANWNTIATGVNGSAHSDHHMIVADPGFNNNTNKKVYFSNDGGIYRADDVSTASDSGGWTKLNNFLGVTQFYSAAANSAGVIVGGTQDNGTLRYSGDPEDWTSMFGGDGGYSTADPTDTNYFYGEYVKLEIVRSTDAGSSSGYIYCNPPPTDVNGGPCTAPATGITDAANGANFIAPILLDPNEPNRLYGGGLSLWRSDDIKAAGLPTWTAVKPPVAPRPPVPIPPATPKPTPGISAIAISRSNSDFVVVGHNDGQLYLSFDGTSSVPNWLRIDAGIPAARFVTRLVIDEKRSPNWIYATLGGFAPDNVYVTKDFGNTWTDVSGSGATGLPSVPIRSLTISPVRPDFIYVGTEIGVFASEDAGSTWGLPQDGPANVPVDDLFWLNGDLVAVTYGRGLYKTAHPVFGSSVCVPPIPACPCFGEWNCPCSWNIQRIPTQNDDIAIVCNMHLGPGLPGGVGQAKNIAVTSVLTMDVDLAVAGNVTNTGNIRRSAPGILSNISCASLSNSHTSNGGLTGDISLLGGISVVGNTSNYGQIALGTRIDTNDLTTGAGSTLTAPFINVKGDLENSGLIEAPSGMTVTGNIFNPGSLHGTFLNPTAPAARVKNYSGSGLWQFGSLSIPVGFTVALRSDVRFDIASASNNGTLDFGNNTLDFKGDSFQGNGTALGTGTLRFDPTSGNSIFNANGPAVTIASGTVEYQSGGTISGPFTIDSGATFAMNTGGVLTASDDVTVNGAVIKTGGNPVFAFNGQTFTNNGSVGNIDFFTFNDGAGPPVQFVTGGGTWSPVNINVGAGTPTRLNLGTNVTFAANQLITATGATIDVGTGLTLGLTGPMNFFRGKITGAGLVKIQPASGSPLLGPNLTIDPAVEIASRTVRASGTILNGKLKIDPGATFSLAGAVEANGDVENAGTLNVASGSQSFNFKGRTFINNGSISGNLLLNFGSFFGPPLVQDLGGGGSWAGNFRLLVDTLSTTTLLNDLNYNGDNLFIGGRLNTGAFTLSLPCNVIWGGTGDIIGTIRRTNLAACPGAAIAYGNPFTTIQFTSGTPPTDITVTVGLTAPAGFPNAATRTYFITPTGGSGYTATLRLHYLDSELNGNLESSLQLWRNNGSNWTLQGVTSRNTSDNWVEYTNVTQFSPWAISGPNPPTAASASISGQVRTATGMGIGNAAVTLTAPDGSTRNVTTSSFGYYRIDGVRTGMTYVLRITSKRFTFAHPAIVVPVSDDISGLDFVAEPSAQSQLPIDGFPILIRPKRFIQEH
jgi:hypothetical protein